MSIEQTQKILASDVLNELNTKLSLTGGNITGNITINDKNVLQTINGVNADSNGNIDITFNSNISAGTEDLEAGVSELEHGKFYFVFEYSS